MSSNIQHSAGSGDYGTPHWIVDIAHEVLGGIDVDLASDKFHNQTVKAFRFFTSSGSPFDHPEAFIKGDLRNIFCNPPGSCDREFDGTFSDCLNKVRCTCRLAKRFFNFATMRVIVQSVPLFWVGFNLNQLRTLHWPRGSAVCVLNKRVEYLVNGIPAKAPSHDSFLALVGGPKDKFYDLTRKYGQRMEVL